MLSIFFSSGTSSFSSSFGVVLVSFDESSFVGAVFVALATVLSGRVSVVRVVAGILASGDSVASRPSSFVSHI